MFLDVLDRQAVIRVGHDELGDQVSGLGGQLGRVAVASLQDRLLYLWGLRGERRYSSHHFVGEQSIEIHVNTLIIGRLLNDLRELIAQTTP